MPSWNLCNTWWWKDRIWWQISSKRIKNNLASRPLSSLIISKRINNHRCNPLDGGDSRHPYILDYSSIKSWIIIIHNFLGNNKTGIVMCYSQEHQTNHCSIHWFKYSFLIDVLHYFAKHAIMFFCHVINQSGWYCGSI